MLFTKLSKAILKSISHAAIVFVVVALSSVAQAVPSGLRLYSWQAHANTPRYVIPVRQGESPKEAIQRYLQKFSESTELMGLFPNGLPQFETEIFEPLSQSRFESQALVIANRAKDYEAQSDRVTNFANLFASAETSTKTQTYVLPIAADLGLNEQEAKDLRTLVATSFSLLTAMGGHDINPSLYNQENRHSVNIYPTRDQSEVELIKTYVTKSEGFMFGICRGHQLTSVALGYELIQDLPTESPSDIAHAKGEHAINVMNTGYGLLTRATEGQKLVDVNTYHHQAVVYRPGGPAVPAAYSPDGIVEGLEFKNGRGLTLQFHPEVMHNTLGRRIMHEIVYAKNRVLRRACRAVFAN